MPFIVRWPGHVAAGEVNKSTVLSAVDWLPTVCAAASVRLPDGYAPDGENMLPALLRKDVQRTKPIFWDWRGKETPKDCWPRAALRVGGRNVKRVEVRVEAVKGFEDRLVRVIQPPSSSLARQRVTCIRLRWVASAMVSRDGQQVPDLSAWLWSVQ